MRMPPAGSPDSRAIIIEQRSPTFMHNKALGIYQMPTSGVGVHSEFWTVRRTDRCRDRQEQHIMPVSSDIDHYAEEQHLSRATKMYVAA